MRPIILILSLSFALNAFGQNTPYHIQIDSSRINDLNLEQIDYAEIGNLNQADSNSTYHPKRLTKEQLTSLNTSFQPTYSHILSQDFTDSKLNDYWITIIYKHATRRHFSTKLNYIQENINNRYHREVKEMSLNNTDFFKNLWNGAIEESCDCEAIINLDKVDSLSEIYKKAFLSIDSMNSSSTEKQYNDEQYGFGVIAKDSFNYFYMVPQNIWIPKTNLIYTNRSNYNNPLMVMEEPSRKSKVLVAVPWTVNSDNEILIIKNCHKGWIKVSFNWNNKAYTGWVEYGCYCSNPYTTCN